MEARVFVFVSFKCTRVAFMEEMDASSVNTLTFFRARLSSASFCSLALAIVSASRVAVAASKALVRASITPISFSVVDTYCCTAVRAANKSSICKGLRLLKKGGTLTLAKSLPR